MPRAGLTTERVIDAAAVMADEVGLGQLTLAALAERLGVRQPSLYKHIESVAGLRRGISLRAKADLATALSRAAVGRSGPDAVRATARAYRTWALAHPGRYEAAQVVPGVGEDDEDEAASLAVMEILIDVLAAYELEGDDAIDAIRALRAALHGFVVLELGRGFRLSADLERSFERLVDGCVMALASWTDPVAPTRRGTSRQGPATRT